MSNSVKPVCCDPRQTFLENLSGTYHSALWRYFYRRVQNRDEADDLTQELFMRIVRKADLDTIENPEAFLFQAASNLLRDRGRRQHTARGFMNEITASNAQNIEAISPERVLDSKQTLQAVLVRLQALDQRTRDVFILHRIEGMSQAHLADLYGVSVSSIEKYIRKCLAHLIRPSPNRK